MLDTVNIHIADVVESGSGVGVHHRSLLVEAKLLLGLLLFSLCLLCLLCLLLLLGGIILLLYLGLIFGLLSLFGLGLALLFLLCCCGNYAHKQRCHDDKNRLTYVSHCIS